MTPETPTPETDAFKRTVGTAWHDFAEKLERERDAARAEIDAMREVLKEAHTTLESIAKAKPSEWGEMSDQFKPWAQNRARHAFTKLQPFITLEA